MNVASLSATTALPEQSKAKNVADAAAQFEAILIAQMLRSVQENSQSDDPAGAPMLDLANQHLAELLAKNGGLGLSKLIAKGLESPETVQVRPKG